MSRESSASEGEIVEPPQKANTAANHPRESGINLPSRGLGLDGTSDANDYKYRDRTRSPSPFRNKVRDRSPSPYRRDRDRNRSPSPFRHNRDHRGHDTKGGYHKRKASPPRHNRPDKRQFSNRDRLHNRRPQGQYDSDRTGSRQSGPHKDRENGSDRNALSRLSYADTEHYKPIPNFNNGLSHDKSPRNRQSNGILPNGRPQELPSGNTATSKSTDTAQSKHNADVEMTSAAEEEPDLTTTTAAEEKIPSIESREEKRRRWAAIRAQRATESSGLLQQALLGNASESTTPAMGSPATPREDFISPSGSPRSPRMLEMDSVPASPDVMVVDKLENRSPGMSPAVDSPAAADYDPTQDTMDDRLRAENHAQQNGMSAAAYDETNPKMLSTLPAEKIKPAKKKKKELDMFAFSDEEDEEEEEDAEATEDQIIAPIKGTVLDAKLLDNWDDVDGYYKIISNELVYDGRYRMIKPLGRGVFANVAQAEDVANQKGDLVAIKIVRRNDAMRKASAKEMDFLRRLNETDPQDKRHIIRLLGSFDHKGHLCIVFEHMAKNLRDLLKEETSGHGLALSAVKLYARQMFSGLKHLQDCQIVHADLKPDNILVSIDKKTVKIADLGTAADKRDNQEPTPYLVSRFYRAPEIILGMEIGYAVDMWAIGCTVYELWTGKILFPGRSNNQMIKVIMECMGWPSEKLLKKGLLSGQHFEAGPPLKLISREVDQFGNPVLRKIEQQRLSSRPLKTRVQEASRDITVNVPTQTDLNDFGDLLGACLNWNFEKRIQPKEALTHRFFVKPSLAPRSTVVKPAVTKPRGFGPRR